MEFSFDVNEMYYRIGFTRPVRYISSAPFNGGFGRKSEYVNRHVEKDYNSDPEVDVGEFLIQENIPVEDAVVTLTAVDVSTYRRQAEAIGDCSMEIFLTAGFDNAVSIGNMNNLYGTINICMVTDLPLSDSASINLIQSMIEAKTQCMNDFSIKDRESGKIAPGTSTDTVTLFILSDKKSIKYAGRITEYGYHASELVYKNLSILIDKK
ncbi:MAG: adenosylcobinamide amidohydrolase [Candidatus Thermoplasmatota archaeon]|jgi:adenosylcobinamide amidohydrolase|nr:adenosylcobinamide amidohydrolase [Candidatus Thermoplasmatota archaeon]MCL5790791.1 adenosylcobinamide amidohydrolase [Candidatus Thermoplasmatota archaeon]